jgi:hypothetical protein
LVNSDVYYVSKIGNNNNDGSLAHPWPTIEKAASIVIAGDTVNTVNIEAGTYHERVIPANSGVAGNPITYQPYASDAVIIDASGISSGSTGAVYINGKNYITFGGTNPANRIEIKNSDYAGVMLTGAATYCTIQNLYIHDTVIGGIHAMSAWTPTSNILTHLTIDGVEVYHTNSTANQEMISLIGVDSFEIKNSKVHDPLVNRIGIDMKVGCTNGSVHNNDVYSIPTGDPCIYVDSFGRATANVNIYNNKVHDSAGQGIVINDEQHSVSVSGINVYNNLIWNTHWGFAVNLEAVTGAKFGFTFINNALYNNGSQTEVWINTTHLYLNNCIIRNNIIDNPLSHSYGTENDDYAAGGVNVDHNLFYNSRGS